jgi:hypothetical protein
MFLSSGFDAFISKPIDVIQLDTVLRRWARSGHGQLLRQEEQKAERKPSVLEGGRVEGVSFPAGVAHYGSENAYMQILRSFTIHTPALVEKMRGVSRETLANYAVTVHGIKGASAGIYAGTVTRQAQILESAARSGDFETVRERNGVFIETVETLLSALRELPYDVLENFKKENKDAPDGVLLMKLLDAAEHFNFATMDEILTELERYRYDSNEELVTWLREQLDELAYGAIQERLETVVGKTEGRS